MKTKPKMELKAKDLDSIKKNLRMTNVRDKREDKLTYIITIGVL